MSQIDVIERLVPGTSCITHSLQSARFLLAREVRYRKLLITARPEPDYIQYLFDRSPSKRVSPSQSRCDEAVPFLSLTCRTKVRAHLGFPQAHAVRCQALHIACVPERNAGSASPVSAPLFEDDIYPSIYSALLLGRF